MVTIVQRTKGHYDVQEVEFGRVYRWRLERVTPNARGDRTSSVFLNSRLPPVRGQTCRRLSREGPTDEQLRTKPSTSDATFEAAQ